MSDNSQQIYARLACAMTDAFGSLPYLLNVSAAMPVAGIVACMIHTIVTRGGTPRT